LKIILNLGDVIRKRIQSFAAACALIVLGSTSGHGQEMYQVGDVVGNFSLTDRNSGRPVTLDDFDGKVVLLEWFAWWCPFCQAAAAEIEPNIVEFYENRAGNANGVPFMHVAINLQGGQEQQTQQFIDAFRLNTVLNDFDRALADRFQPFGQPIFAVINGVSNSPSHQKNELVFSNLGFGNLSAPVAQLRAAIDSVSPAAAAAPEITWQPSNANKPVGGTAQFTVAATSDSDISYQWRKNGTPIAGQTTDILVFELVEEADAGNYDVVLTNATGQSISDSVALNIVDPIPGKITNMSVRSITGLNGQPLIVGFSVAGGTKSVLIRGIGPTLRGFGVADAISDPLLSLFSGADQIGANNNWQEAIPNANENEFQAVGAFPLPLSSLDSSLLTDINGGASIFLTDAQAETGIVLAEVYDASLDESRLVNVSARNFVGTDGDILIIGFSLSGNLPQTILIRGVGPELANFGVPGTIENPQLELFSSTGIIASNDDWEQADNAAEVATAVPGAFPLTTGSRDSAILITLQPGVYSALLSGVDGATGEGLVEVYTVE